MARHRMVSRNSLKRKLFLNCCWLILFLIRKISILLVQIDRERSGTVPFCGAPSFRRTQYAATGPRCGSIHTTWHHSWRCYWWGLGQDNEASWVGLETWMGSTLEQFVCLRVVEMQGLQDWLPPYLKNHYLCLLHCCNISDPLSERLWFIWSLNLGKALDTWCGSFIHFCWFLEHSACQYLQLSDTIVRVERDSASTYVFRLGMMLCKWIGTEYQFLAQGNVGQTMVNVGWPAPKYYGSQSDERGWPWDVASPDRLLWVFMER